MILTILAAAGAAAVTPGSQLNKDLHCVAAISSAIGMAKTENDKSQMIAGNLYFLGKVDGESPGLDLEQAMVDVVSGADFAKRLPDEMRRCGAELQSRGQAMVEVGKALTKRGL